MSRRSDPREALAQGVAAHRAGRLDEAAALYRRVLEAMPRQPDALNLLATVALARGEAAEAKVLAARAVDAAPREPSYRATLARSLLATGAPDEALRELGPAVAVAPRNAELRALRATALRASGRPDEAERELRAALEAEPAAWPLWDDLAALLVERKRYADAEPCARRSLELRADGPQALNVLGLVLARTGRAEEGERALRRALEVAPRAPQPLANLAALLAASGRSVPALALWRELVALRPTDAGAWRQLAQAALEVGELDGAREAAERALALAPDDQDAVLAAVSARHLAGDQAGAEALVDAELARRPSAAAHLAHGALQRAMGDVAGAREAFAAALALDPGSIAARVALVDSGRCASPDDPQLRALQKVVADPGVDEASRTLAGYALAKCFDDLGDATAAFEAAQRANRARRAARPRYDAAGDAAMLARVQAAFGSGIPGAPPAAASGAGRPVFVVGVPRSGTTLVEQVIAAHPAARTAGELQTLPRLAAALAAPGYPEAVAGLDGAARTALAARYRAAAVRAAGGEAERLCDKSPLNFRLLGLVAALFPDALVVHCDRHPLDACLSMFLQDFRFGSEFANDLDDLAQFYANYRATMALWRAVLPLPIIEVRYESLVAAPEVEARRLVDALGLPWDPRCATPERAPTSVRTASAWQVRQPVNTRSVGKWRRYARQLEPLRDALRARGVEVE